MTPQSFRRPRFFCSAATIDDDGRRPSPHGRHIEDSGCLDGLRSRRHVRGAEARLHRFLWSLRRLGCDQDVVEFGSYSATQVVNLY